MTANRSNIALEQAFADVANAVLLARGTSLQAHLATVASFCGLRCPDQVVGQAIVRAGQFHYLGDIEAGFERHSIEALAESNRRRLILILESPHVDEYRFDRATGRLVPAGPANGSTGRHIRKYLHRQKMPDPVLWGLRDGDIVGIVLVNAVPFQCSLGVPTSQFRDAVFSAAWQHPVLGRDYFLARLDSLWRKEDLVINCCTKGALDESLADMVMASLHQLLAQRVPVHYPVHRLTHPYRWFDPRLHVA